MNAGEDREGDSEGNAHDRSGDGDLPGGDGIPFFCRAKHRPFAPVDYDGVAGCFRRDRVLERVD